MMKQFLLFYIAACFLFANLSKAQTAAADNIISGSITLYAIPRGPEVLGVFQGRCPSRWMVNKLKIASDAGCDMIKCGLTLYRDAATLRPATYSLSIVGAGDIVKQEGGAYRHKLLEGKWGIVKSARPHPGATIYCLELDKAGECLYLLKGDDNVLFVLDENKDFLVGNEDFSYTLNRVKLVPAKKQ